MPDAGWLKPGFARAASSWRSAASSPRDASSPPAFHGNNTGRLLPVIKVPTVTLDSEANGIIPAGNGRSPADESTIGCPMRAAPYCILRADWLCITGLLPGK
jgi:hypothetical protein